MSAVEGARLGNEVWAAACTLSERFAGGLEPDPRRRVEGDARWARLRALLDGYGPEATTAFCREFATESAEMPSRLAPQRPTGGSAPAWLGLLEALAEPLGRADWEKSDRPFGEWLEPLRRRVEAELQRELGQRAHWLPASAWRRLGEALRDRWEREFAPALYAAFDLERSVQPLGRATPVGGELYREFVGSLACEGIGAVARRYPVAVRLWAIVTHHWRAALLALTEHFEADRAALQRDLGVRDLAVSCIEWPLSDFHAGGRAVARLEFVGGEIVYYKPGDRSLDVAFDRLLRSPAVRRRPGEAPGLQGVIREDRSWLLGLKSRVPESAVEARRLARDLGRLGLVGLVCGAIDLHPGNVIAGGSWAAVCDAETVLHPEEPTFPWQAPFLSDRWENLENPFRTFLSSFDVLGEPEIRLRSCLGAWREEPAKVRTWRWQGLGTDALRLDREVGTWANEFAPAFDALRSRLGDRWPIPVLAGATDARTRLLASRETLGRILEELGACPRRIIRRNTVAYVWLLAEARQPMLWVDGFERSLFLEALGSLGGGAWPLESWERAALDDGDVPRLEVRGLAPELLADLLRASRPIFDSAASKSLSQAWLRAWLQPAGPVLGSRAAKL